MNQISILFPCIYDLIKTVNKRAVLVVMIPLHVFLLVITFLSLHRLASFSLISLHLCYLRVLENVH